MSHNAMAIYGLVLTACVVSESHGLTELIQPGDFTYGGAFRLPGGDIRPETFAYGGNAMTYNPDGDPAGRADGFRGTLFVMGHDRLPYGELPDGNQIAEITIPKPVVSTNVEALSRAEFVQPFRNAAKGMFPAYDEIPRVGMQYLANSGEGPRIYLAWGQHFHEDAEKQVATHGSISTALDHPSPKGPWFVGEFPLYSVSSYVFEIPAAWAARHVDGRILATGRYRDGGWSGQGPALFAFNPRTGDKPNTRVEATALLLYENSRNTENVVNRSMRGYQHADEWEDGAWLTTDTGKSAVLFAGTKGTGAKYWYGWVNPAGPDKPCVETEFVNQFNTCRNADGTPCGREDLVGCEGHTDYRGWWSSRFVARFILYNPDDFAQVAAGSMKLWEPQPYAQLDLDDRLFLNPSRVEEDMLGAGVQRRYRISAVAYDRGHGLLYVLEPFADATKPVVHVWAIQ